MGFIMDGLDAETYDRKYDDRQLISRIIGYFRPQLSLMLFVAVLVVLTSLMDTAFPLLIARSLDIITAAQSAQIIGLLIATILITGVLSWTFNFLRQRYTARSVGNVVLNLQQDAFSAIVARDMSFYDEYPSGKIVSRVTSDTEQLQAGSTGTDHYTRDCGYSTGFSLDRAAHYTALSEIVGARQRQCAGSYQRHHRGQKLSPGTEYV